MKDFITLGYFEEVIEVLPGGETGKCLGTRPVREPDGRELGYAGKRTETWTTPTALWRGYRQIRVRATEREPVTVITMLQRVCGPVGDKQV